jgi:hypothetical protein
MRRHYYYTAIASTPFTLVVSLPDKYGASKVHGVEEIRRSLAEGEKLTIRVNILIMRHPKNEQQKLTKKKIAKIRIVSNTNNFHFSITSKF